MHRIQNYKLSDLVTDFLRENSTCRRHTKQIVTFEKEPANDNQFIKTVTIQMDEMYTKLSSKERNDLNRYPKRLLEQAYLEVKPSSPVSSCPLYRTFETDKFLVMHFHDGVPRKVIELLLKTGISIKILGQQNVLHFTYFGQSNSQLRNRTCVLYSGSELGDIEGLISTFGDFSTLKTPSKRSARIGLLLSSSLPTIHLKGEEIVKINDIERNDFNFTDGCGFMSTSLVKKIMHALSPERNEADSGNEIATLPSAFQVRIKGCKGMLVHNPKLPSGIQVRPSMEKFNWIQNEPYVLGIVDNGKAYSKPFCFGSLNKQFIRLLSALGIEDEVFLRKQEKYFKELDELMTSRYLQIKYLFASGHVEMAEKLLQTNNAPDIETLSTLRKIANEARTSRSRDKAGSFQKASVEPARKLRIPIEESRNVYGIADPTGKIEYGCCFFQPTMGDGPCAQPLHGISVVICKNPCYHPGDIRVLKCQDVIECRHLVDCIVFPTQGPRPHQDEIAGSDLDGDKYFVCWDKELIPKRQREPTSYQGATPKPWVKITHEDLVNYFANYDKFMVSQLDRYYSGWADAKGVDSKECLLLANLFNRAIDSAKTVCVLWRATYFCLSALLLIHPLRILERNAAYAVNALYSQQQGARAIPLKQEVLKNFCKLSSKSDLYS